MNEVVRPKFLPKQTIPALFPPKALETGKRGVFVQLNLIHVLFLCVFLFNFADYFLVDWADLVLFQEGLCAVSVVRLTASEGKYNSKKPLSDVQFFVIHFLSCVICCIFHHPFMCACSHHHNVKL